MAKRDFAKEPLLYIHQPNVGKVQAPMQHSYISNRKRKTEKVQEDKEIEAVPKKVNRRQNSFQQGKETKQPTYSKDNNGEEGIEPRRKNFKDMDITERINYFITRPTFAPQVRCEIRTEDRKYRGVILDFQENKVYLKIGNRKTPIEILLEDIEDIQLVGF